MRIRLQYSLLTLLVLTTACAVVIAFVVVPWRHEKQQDEIMERLEAHRANEDHYLWHLHKNDDDSFDVVYSSNRPEHFQTFIDLANGSERIHSLSLQTEGFNDEQLAMLKQLPKLERLYFDDCDLNETRTQNLRTLPIKELEFRNLNNVAFQTWPIQPWLESLKFWMMPAYAAPPLKLLAHPHLRELHCDSSPEQVEIDSCPELEEIWLTPRVEESAATLKINNLPKLQTLTLWYSDIHADSQIQELPALQKLSIYSEAFHLFQNHQLQNLKEFECRWFEPLKNQYIEKLLHLPQLEKLVICANWSEYISSGSRIPIMPQLHVLELHESSSRSGKILVPERLAIALIRQSPSLQSLSLPLQDLNAELLQEIATLEHLTYIHLDVRGKMLGDLGALRRCAKLYKLELSFTELTAAQLVQFNELKQIENLHLHHRGEQDVDMTALRARPRLGVQYNHDFFTQSFPTMLPDRKAPRPGFRCNADPLSNPVPTATVPASP